MLNAVKHLGLYPVILSKKRFWFLNLLRATPGFPYQEEDTGEVGFDRITE